MKAPSNRRMSAATRMVSSRFSGCHRWRPHPPPWERARRRLPAGAFVNDIEIMVARGRQGQCGGGRDPRHTGRWRGGAGGVWVQGRKLHEFNLADPAECDRVVKTRVDAPADQRIEVLVVNQGGANRIAAPLSTVAADRSRAAMMKAALPASPHSGLVCAPSLVLLLSAW